MCLARGAYVYLCDIDSKSLNKLNKHPLKNKRLFAYLCDASNKYQVSDFFEKKKSAKFSESSSPAHRKPGGLAEAQHACRGKDGNHSAEMGKNKPDAEFYVANGDIGPKWALSLRNMRNYI